MHGPADLRFMIPQATTCTPAAMYTQNTKSITVARLGQVLASGVMSTSCRQRSCMVEGQWFMVEWLDHHLYG